MQECLGMLPRNPRQVSVHFHTEIYFLPLTHLWSFLDGDKNLEIQAQFSAESIWDRCSFCPGARVPVIQKTDRDIVGILVSDIIHFANELYLQVYFRIRWIKEQPGRSHSSQPIRRLKKPQTSFSRTSILHLPPSVCKGAGAHFAI